MRAGPVLLLGAAAVCFAVALADQISSGNVYSRGSTLRTDREGSSALFEALAKTRKNVERNYVPLEYMPGMNATIIVPQAEEFRLGNPAFADTITALARSGNRVVIAIGGRFWRIERPKGWDVEVQPVESQSDDGEEGEAAWPVSFNPSARWHVVRSEAGRPSVIERSIGSGTLILVASTTPLLNLALRDDRDVPLLEWIVGSGRPVIFDESSLGSRQNGTIVGLMRRLRLQGFIAALMAAALLFFWRASAPFPPVSAVAVSQMLKLLSGAGSAEALRNLLERRVPLQALMGTCFEEWARDFGRRAGPTVLREAAEAAAASAPLTERWERIRGIVRGVKRQ